MVLALGPAGPISFGAASAFPNLSDSGLFPFHGDPMLPYPVLIFVIVALLGAYVLHFTVFGRYVYAIGGNRDAAEYSAP